MPATAGRVRMPPNNRMHSSAALQTHGIWQSVIGYDPYAPKDEKKQSSSSSQPMSTGTATKNPYDNYQDLLSRAHTSGVLITDRTPGGCKKCGRVGHLAFQCRNFLNLKEEKQEDTAVLQVGTGSDTNKSKVNVAEELSEESSEESESSDSDVDSDIERIIAARKKSGGKTKMRSSSKKRVQEDEKKRGRSKKRTCKRRSSDTDDEDVGEKKRRKEKKRRHDDSSDDEEDKRRHHRHRKDKRRKRR
ncbi:hypothetical protein MKW94_005712 [Papaver nudicaule]|uniref:CCHC-type domain-containing protein n=1 Tax=Papaver nudicaule TaxID=74823 RepID=A0AA41S8C7_PAPNU|nr:hypothetical protein [Papaver nudicaule]